MSTLAALSKPPFAIRRVPRETAAPADKFRFLRALLRGYARDEAALYLAYPETDEPHAYNVLEAAEALAGDLQLEHHVAFEAARLEWNQAKKEFGVVAEKLHRAIFFGSRQGVSDDALLIQAKDILNRYNFFLSPLVLASLIDRQRMPTSSIPRKKKGRYGR